MTMCKLCGAEVKYPNNLRLRKGGEVHLTCYWLKRFGQARAETLARQSGLDLSNPNSFHP